jgi:hypothetical protein
LESPERLYEQLPLFVLLHQIPNKVALARSSAHLAEVATQDRQGFIIANKNDRNTDDVNQLNEEVKHPLSSTALS